MAVKIYTQLRAVADGVCKEDILKTFFLPGWFTDALRQTTPIILGYLPVGFAYGVLAQKSGLSNINVLLMSVLVFAGSSQLVAVSLFASAAGPASLILTTVVVNLRHVLLSAALSPYLRGWSKFKLSWFAFQLTDETFALHANRFAAGAQAQSTTFAINAISHLAWVGGTGLGVVAGGMVRDVRPLGLDFALGAMFLFLLLAQLKSRMHVLAACCAACVSLGLHTAGATRFSVIVAALLAATLALGVEKWTRN